MIIKRLSIWFVVILAFALPVFLIGSALADQGAVDMPVVSVVPVSAEPVSAGDPVIFKVVLTNPTGQDRPDLYLNLAWDTEIVGRAQIEVVEEETNLARTESVRRQEGRGRWRGGIRSGGQLTLQVSFMPALCYNDQLQIQLTAEAGAVAGGSFGEDQGSLVASCQANPFVPDNFSFGLKIAPENQMADFSTSSEILQGLDGWVRLELTNNGDQPMNAVVTDSLQPDGGLEKQCRVLFSQVQVETRGAPTLPFDRGFLPPTMQQAAGADGTPFIGFMILELKPGDTWTAEMLIPLKGRQPGCEFSGMASVYPAPANPIPGSCDGGSPNCRYQGWTTKARDLQRLFATLDGYDSNGIQASLVATDLGDAPTSENNFATNMNAYPGVKANFPTVFNFNIGMPPSLNNSAADHGDAPLHRYAYPLRLGNLASIEPEADWNPNRNINPAADLANLDNRDDGLAAANFPDTCKSFDQTIKITIEEWAADYFQENGGTAYLNLFADANGDGDWADAGECDDAPAPEHFIINYPIDINALGPGQHEIQLPANNGVQWQSEQGWLRVMLGEQMAPLNLQSGGVQHGDGAGPEGGFVLGETEDYRVRAGTGLNGTAAPGADVAVRINSTLDVLANHGLPDSAANVQIQATTGCLTCIDPCLIGNIFVRLGNLGDEMAPGGRLTVFPDPSFRSSSPDISVQGDLPWIDNLVTDVACAKGDPDCRVEIDLGNIPPGQFGSIVVTAGHQCEAGDEACRQNTFNAQARINATGDENNQNNQAADQVKLSQTPEWIVPPRINSPLPGTTSDSGIKVMGEGYPGRIVDVFLNDKKIGSGDVDQDGKFLIMVPDIVEMFESAAFELTAGYRPPNGTSQTRRTTVVIDDTGFSIKPNTLQLGYEFPGGAQYDFSPWDLGGRLDPNGWQMPLLPGVETTGSVEHHWWCLTCTLGLNNLDMSLRVNDQLLATLTDPDGDGKYTGSFTPDTSVIGQPVTLHASEEGVEQVFEGRTVAATLPRLIDGATGQPLAGEQVTLWQLVNKSRDTAVWVRPAEINGQPNPRVTAADGSFFFNVAPGVYRLQFNNKGFHDGQFTEPERLFGIYPSRSVMLQKSSANPAKQAAGAEDIVVKLTADGFNPPQITTTTADSITFQNVSLQQRGVSSDELDLSDVLFPPGQSLTISFAEAGEYILYDLQSPQNKLRVVVEAGPDRRVLLPVVFSSP